MTADELKRLDAVLRLAKTAALSDADRDFVDNVGARFDRLKENIVLTDFQWHRLSVIALVIGCGALLGQPAAITSSIENKETMRG